MAETRAPEKQVELTPIHDFAAKLRQPGILERLKDYVRWQVWVRRGFEDGQPVRVPDAAPVSINLDLTTACNFACDHCVDMAILNKGIRFDHERLLASLRLMAERGLKSVIVIGGGEPTTYRYFRETIRFLKELGLQVAIVTNGSGMGKIYDVADCLEACDWVRLSLDAGTDATFQAMHKPRKRITLEEICAGVPPLKDKNPAFKVGFSFIITWRGATIHDRAIVENLDEIVPAAALARRYRFDYIAYKPFLTRAETNNAEIVDLRETDAHFDSVVARIRREVERAKALETETFRVYETTNLKVLENRSYRSFTCQPHQCHMQFFRQVLSPLGTYNCPVYRNQPHGRIGSKEAYADRAAYDATREETAALIRRFDAARECREVTCLYNHVNWWIEHLIRNPELLAELRPEAMPVPDYFL